MNLRLIEQRFQHLETRANYLNYKYNPNCKKIAGLSQHPYMPELKTDHASDLRVFGQDPFHAKAVDSENMPGRASRGYESGSMHSSMAKINKNFDTQPGLVPASVPSIPRPRTTIQGPKKRAVPYKSRGDGFGMPVRNISSTHMLQRRRVQTQGQNSEMDQSELQQTRAIPTQTSNIIEKASLIKKQLVHNKQRNTTTTAFMNQKQFLSEAAQPKNEQTLTQATERGTSFARTTAEQELRAEVSKLMQQLCKIKIPEHITRTIFEREKVITTIVEDERSIIRTANDSRGLNFQKSAVRSTSYPVTKQVKQPDSSNLDQRKDVTHISEEYILKLAMAKAVSEQQSSSVKIQKRDEQESNTLEQLKSLKNSQDIKPQVRKKVSRGSTLSCSGQLLINNTQEVGGENHKQIGKHIDDARVSSENMANPLSQPSPATQTAAGAPLLNVFRSSGFEAKASYQAPSTEKNEGQAVQRIEEGQSLRGESAALEVPPSAHRHVDISTILELGYQYKQSAEYQNSSRFVQGEDNQEASPLTTSQRAPVPGVKSGTVSESGGIQHQSLSIPGAAVSLGRGALPANQVLGHAIPSQSRGTAYGDGKGSISIGQGLSGKTSEAHGGQLLTSSKIQITNKLNKIKATSEDEGHTIETLAGYAAAQAAEKVELTISNAPAKATLGTVPVTAASVVERTQPRGTSGEGEVKNKKQLYFSIKLTDVSELSNPFVIFDDRPIKQDGFLFLTDRQASMDKKRGQVSQTFESPCSLFPWLRRLSDIKHRTFKIEVIYETELVLSRYLHLGRLCPVEYPKIALQISNNIYQNQYLLYKEKKINQMLAGEEFLLNTNQVLGTFGDNEEDAAKTNTAEFATKIGSSNKDIGNDEGQVFQQAIKEKEEVRNLLLETRQIFVFDGAKNIKVEPDQCSVQMMKLPAVKNILQNDMLNETLRNSQSATLERNAKAAVGGGVQAIIPFYFFINPARDRNIEVLEKLRAQIVHLQDLPEYLRHQQANASSDQVNQLLFPQFHKFQQKIVIECQDCIIQGIDLLDFHILVDQNKQRVKALIEFDDAQKQSLGQPVPVRGKRILLAEETMQATTSKWEVPNSFNVVFGEENQVNQSQEIKSKSVQKLRQYQQAQQQRGVDFLVRKQMEKLAYDQSRTVYRNPRDPNAGLKGEPGEKRPKCAAELTNKAEIFKHLNHTSLLTAPIFSRGQMDQIHFNRFLEHSANFLNSQILMSSMSSSKNQISKSALKRVLFSQNESMNTKSMIRSVSGTTPYADKTVDQGAGHESRLPSQDITIYAGTISQKGSKKRGSQDLSHLVHEQYKNGIDRNMSDLLVVDQSLQDHLADSLQPNNVGYLAQRFPLIQGTFTHISKQNIGTRSNTHLMNSNLVGLKSLETQGSQVTFIQPPSLGNQQQPSATSIVRHNVSALAIKTPQGIKAVISTGTHPQSTQSVKGDEETITTPLLIPNQVEVVQIKQANIHADNIETEKLNLTNRLKSGKSIDKRSAGDYEAAQENDVVGKEVDASLLVDSNQQEYVSNEKIIGHAKSSAASRATGKFSSLKLQEKHSSQDRESEANQSNAQQLEQHYRNKSLFKAHHQYIVSREPGNTSVLYGAKKLRHSVDKRSSIEKTTLELNERFNLTKLKDIPIASKLTAQPSMGDFKPILSHQHIAQGGLIQKMLLQEQQAIIRNHDSRATSSKFHSINSQLSRKDAKANHNNMMFNAVSSKALIQHDAVSHPAKKLRASFNDTNQHQGKSMLRHSKINSEFGRNEGAGSMLQHRGALDSKVAQTMCQTMPMKEI